MEPLYHNSILAGAVITGALALCLMLVKPPAREEYATYRRAKLLLAIGYAVYSLGISVFIVYPLRREMPMLCPAVNLTYYFAAMFLFGYSFISLLSPGYYTRARSRRFLLTWGGYVAALWSLTLLSPAEWQPTVLLGFGGWFLVETLVLTRRFVISYAALRRQLNENYADSTVMFIRWLNTSAWLVIFFGILCGVFAFLSPLCISLLLVAGCGVFVYIYVSIQNYALNLPPVQLVADNPLRPLPISGSQEPQEAGVGAASPGFVNRLDRWIDEEGYLDDRLTLNLLAEIIGTNRSYLSTHINITYGKNFSEWINGMRVSHACRILEAEPTLPIEDVAHKAGFSSASYFSRIFKSVKGVTPSAWRQGR